jgi:CBS domain-containing protein
MNIISFIKPKNEVILLYDDMTVEETLEIMEKYRFSTIPIITRDGSYVGTLSEGDLLWEIKNIDCYQIDKARTRLISKVKRLRDYGAINYNSSINMLIAKAADENFVPIVDDSNQFIGIVTRKTLLNYFFEHNFIVL